jgi:putative MATE family efflux protein
MGLGMGLQIMTSRRMASGQYGYIGRIVNHGLLLGLVCSVVSVLLVQLGMPFIMQYYLQNAEIRTATLEYITIRALDMPFLYFFMLMRGFYTGTGQSRIIMWSTFIIAGVNLLLCMLLVAGMWGFPTFGVAGAAWATVMAQSVGAAFMLAYAYRKGYVRKYHLFRREKQRGYIYHRMLALSGPTILQYMLSMLGFLYLKYEVEKLGPRPLAVSELVKTTYLTLMIPIWGFQAAASALVSYAIGAGHNKAVIPLIKRISGMSLAVIAFTCLPLFLLPDALFSIYTDDINILSMARIPGYIVGVGLLLLSVGAVLMNGVIGAGATRFALYAEIILIASYIAYIAMAAHIWEPTLGGLWSCEFIYMGGMVVLFGLYLRSGRWQGKVV